MKERLSVLIVDNAFFMRNLLKKAISKKIDDNFQFEIVSEATTGIEGIELYNICKSEIIIVKINTPGIDDCDFFNKVRQINNNVSIIIVSTGINLQIKEQLKKENTYFLSKTFQTEILFNLLNKITNKYIKEYENFIPNDKDIFIPISKNKDIVKKEVPYKKLKEENKVVTTKPAEITLIKDNIQNVSNNVNLEEVLPVLDVNPINTDNSIETNLNNELELDLKNISFVMDLNKEDESIIIEIIEEKKDDLQLNNEINSLNIDKANNPKNNEPEKEVDIEFINIESINKQSPMKSNENEISQLLIECKYDYDEKVISALRKETDKEMISNKNTLSVEKTVLSNNGNKYHSTIIPLPNKKELSDLDVALNKLKTMDLKDISSDEVEKTIFNENEYHADKKVDSTLKMELNKGNNRYNDSINEKKPIIAPLKKEFTDIYNPIIKNKSTEPILNKKKGFFSKIFNKPE